MGLLSRRFGLLVASIAFSMVSFGQSEGRAKDGSLTMASHGGAYTRSQIISYVDPFREGTGQWVEVVDYEGGLEDLRDQTLSLNVKWDVVDMSAVDAIRACEEGLLEKLEGLPLAPSLSNVPATEDFLEGSLLPCAIGQNIWATVIAYDTAAYKGSAVPETLEDFFDLERFPGSRGLQKTPRVNLEWALLADGVAPGSIYPLLETDAGVERALAVLERIRPAIVWWTRGEQPLYLLQSRRVAMSSAWSGRVFFRNSASQGPFGTIWDGNVWEREYWAIPKGAPNAEKAKTFITFASDPKRQAVQANQIGYSPARRSAMTMVEQKIHPFLPTAPENVKRGIASDAEWWARNSDRLEAAFFNWLEGKKEKKRIYRRN